MTPARSGVSIRLLPALFLGLMPSLATVFHVSLISQTAPVSAVITAVDASAFPTVDVRVAVRGENGGHLTDLPAAAFALTENGEPVPGLTVSPIETGVQVAFVVAPDDIFSKRDETGTSRLEYVRQSVADFVRGYPWMRDNLDDISIIAPDGPLTLHSRVGSELQAQLAGYDPGPPSAQPVSALLSQVLGAVDVALPVGPRQGAAAAVVVYASGLSNVTPDQIDLAAAQARAQGVPVYAVNVSPPIEPESVSAANLRRLAEGSGGQMLYFTMPDGATPIFEAIAGRRAHYRLTYRSTLAASGQAAVAVTVTPAEGTPATSNPASFALTVLPPQIAVTGIPAEIRRDLTASSVGPASVAPDSQVLQVQVTFPDGHPRSLRSLQLLVDGQAVSAVAAAPFEAITWDLAGYTSAGTHDVQVTATDELGLSVTSALAEVVVSVVAPTPPPPWTSTARLAAPLAGVGAAALALAVLAAGVIALLRRRPGLFARLSALADRDESAQSGPHRIRVSPARPFKATAPPAPVSPQVASKPRLSPSRLPRTPADVPTGRAHLEVIQLSEASKAPIELIGGPITLGRDPALAVVTFSDRSVSRLHARVEADAAGVFHIYDQGSTSGTWVNYEQVSASGRPLRHGDLINLGRVQLRFRLRPAEADRRGPPRTLRPVAPERGAGADTQPPRDDTTIPYKPKRKPWDRIR